MEYCATITEGGKRARTLGFPTINIPLSDTEPSGIYAGTVILDDRMYEAAVYADQRRGVLEAHVLDFNEEVYGNEASITLLKKIRNDKLFSDDEALKVAIAEDLRQVREYFLHG